MFFECAQPPHFRPRLPSCQGQALRASTSRSVIISAYSPAVVRRLAIGSRSPYHPPVLNSLPSRRGVPARTAMTSKLMKPAPPLSAGLKKTLASLKLLIQAPHPIISIETRDEPRAVRLVSAAAADLG